MRAVLSMEDLCFSYYSHRRRLPVLDSVGFSLGVGERAVIVGRSGGGKSTLLDLAAGIYLPERGTVRLDGNELSRLSEGARAKVRLNTVGFVRQSFDLIGNLNALDNVAVALRLRGEAVDDARERASACLRTLDMGNRLGHRPGELSGGERQRVALARAVVGEPKLLLADEPTGSLDATLRDEALAVLLSAAEGRALVVVTHDPSVAERVQGARYTMVGGTLRA